MALIYNNTTIPETGTIKYGNTSLKKIIYGTKTVWRKKELKTGNLFAMTSNTSPTPFVVSDWSTSGCFWGDDNTLAYKAFKGDSSYYYKQANVVGNYCGAQILFNQSTKKIFPVTIVWRGVNADAGDGGGGGSVDIQYRNSSGTWVNLGHVEDNGASQTSTMDGNTEVTGLRIRTNYGSGSSKWLEVGPVRVTKWYEQEA